MKGAIFDVDGTLLDSMTVWRNITERFLKKYDIIFLAMWKGRIRYEHWTYRS